MEDNKEQILADFQSCTGIDDVAECIMHLEHTNWNLLEAINSVMPSESQTLPSERDAELPMDVLEGAMGSSRANFVNITDSSAPMALFDLTNSVDEAQLASRLLNFSVHYQENLVPLEVPESETVASIKAALHTELGVPPCRQELNGWSPTTGQGDPITDETILSSLRLPQRTNLFLSARELIVPPSTNSDSDRSSTRYKLHIVDTINSKDYELSFPGSKTVLEVKLDVRDITNIPVRFQKWIGWPDTLKDENAKLAILGNPDKTLDLILAREESSHKSKKTSLIDLASSESDNEFEDAAECFGVEDDIFQATTFKRVQPLMPDEVDDELAAVTHFEQEFASRYGYCHPPFQGTLADALQLSCHKPAKERKPLAIYLHHDASVLTNVFCSQHLCSETVVNYLLLNYITWAWDITFENNKTFLLASLTQQLGLLAANTVKNLELSALPAIVIISKSRSTPEVLTVIPGNVGLEELMSQLVNTVDLFNTEIQSEIWEEEEREARENVKREQDAAYQESLIADMAKEEARRHEIEEKMKQEEKEAMQKEEQEQMRQHEEAVKDAVRKSLAEQLPPEPSSSNNQLVSEIRVRLPNGEIRSRTFTADAPLKYLLIYIASEGYPTEEFKVLASWPRVDLTSVDQQKTLGELKLYPKETVTLEEK